MITPDFKFRQSILTMLYELKLEMDDDFSNVIESLKETMDDLPTNDFEESYAFFTKVTRTILSELEDYYEVDHSQLNAKSVHYDLFALKIDEDIAIKIELFERYTTNNAKFTNSFLNHFDYNLWRKLRFQNMNRPFTQAYSTNPGGTISIKRNQIDQNNSVFLPNYVDHVNRPHLASSNYSYLSVFYKQAIREKKAIREMLDLYEPLEKAVEAFKAKIMEYVKESNKRFGVASYKDMLSEIMLPVELLVNEELKNKCIEEERRVFVKRPKEHHLLKVGMSVHVYAAPDLSNDSFIAKPVPVTGTPKEIRGLIYVGSGHYTGYNEESPRSLNKVSPHIINENLFVKININDFLKELPKKIREEIKNCETLLDSIGFEEEEIELKPNRYYREFLEDVQNAEVSNVNKLITYYMDSVALLSDTGNEQRNPQQNDTNDLFKDTNFSFNMDLLTKHPSLPYKYALLQDTHSGNAALKLEDGKQAQIFISKDLDECCEALSLNTGLYSVYSFYKRDLYRSQAFLTFHKYTREERSE